MARIKEWEELTISDNFLFQKVMQNKRLCKRLIQKLLKINVKKIIYPIAEKSIAIGATSKSVRLDLYVAIIVHLRHDFQRGKRCLTLSRRIER